MKNIKKINLKIFFHINLLTILLTWVIVLFQLILIDHTTILEFRVISSEIYMIILIFLLIKARSYLFNQAILIVIYMYSLFNLQISLSKLCEPLNVFLIKFTLLFSIIVLFFNTYLNLLKNKNFIDFALPIILSFIHFYITTFTHSFNYINLFIKLYNKIL